jgi:hypothetical protein
MRTLATALSLLCATAALAAGDGWEVASKKNGLTISSRSKPGTDVKEVKALGTFDAPPWVVKNVVDDVAHYKDFMPYTVESTVFAKRPFAQDCYQLLKMPFISDRDYVIRVRDLSKVGPDGKIIYKNAWSPTSGGPPLKEGVVRLNINEGYWQLEELDGGAKTKATYYVYTDPGGSLPSWAVNAANTQAIPELFAAVAERAKDPRYQVAAPPIPDAPVTPPTVAAPPTSIGAPGSKR